MKLEVVVHLSTRDGSPGAYVVLVRTRLPRFNPGFGVEEKQEAHIIRTMRHPVFSKRNLQFRLIDDPIGCELPPQKPVSNEVVVGSQYLHCERVRAAFHSPADNIRRKLGGEGAPCRRAIDAALASHPAGNGQCRFDDGLRQKRCDLGEIKSPVVSVHIMLGARDHGDMSTFPGQRVRRRLQPGMRWHFPYQVSDPAWMEKLRIERPAIFGAAASRNGKSTTRHFPNARFCDLCEVA